MLCGEADVGAREGGEPAGEVVRGVAHGGVELAAQPLETRLGQRVEQRLLVGEMAARRGVADADLARQLAQRQRPRSALPQRQLRPFQQGGPEVAVVVATCGGRGHVDQGTPWCRR
jgi:hypothetical protein